MPQFVRIPSLGILIICFASCGIPQAISEAIARVENMMATVDRTTNVISAVSSDWKDQSNQWRQALQDLEENFAKDNQKLLGETLRNTADHVIAQTGGEYRADIDFLQIKLLNTLKFISKALQAAHDQLEQAKSKRDVSKVQSIMDSISNIKVWDDPVIVSFTPNHLQMDWLDYTKTKFKISTERRIEASGWGFDRPAGQELNLHGDVVGSNGSTRPLTSLTFSKTTNYLLQVTLGDDVSQFQAADQKLAITCGTGPNDRRELPIIWGNAPPKPPPAPPAPDPEYVTKVRIDFWTLGDDKDQGDGVTHSITADDVVVSTASYGSEMTWGDNSGPYPVGLIRGGPLGLPRGFDRSEAVRTFTLTTQVEVGKNKKGRFSISKSGDKGWEFRVNIYAFTNKNNTKQYDANWHDFFKGGHQSASWDFSW